jgi:hypothetical protein
MKKNRHTNLTKDTILFFLISTAVAFSGILFFLERLKAAHGIDLYSLA